MPVIADAMHPDGCILVLFGARGDLVRRLIMPSVYNLAVSGYLPENFAIVGVDHGDETSDGWGEKLYASLRALGTNSASESEIGAIDPDIWQSIAAKLSYVRGDFTDPELFDALSTHLDTLQVSSGRSPNVIFYLAVAEGFFAPIISNLTRSNLTNQRDGWRRVIIEKPFGTDLASARSLCHLVHTTLKDEQIYLIDHFLGKNAVQNIATLRFHNALFEPLWNRTYIDHVQITVAETLGVETRGKFYETTGALRDMIPNHLFSMLALVAMERPAGVDAASLDTAREQFFRAVKPITPGNAVRGQYGAGSAAGTVQRAYRGEPNVGRASATETFAAVRLEIENERWRNVPFYLRTGKHLVSRASEIALVFKSSSLMPPNTLVINVAPAEGVTIQFLARNPDPKRNDDVPATFDFSYAKLNRSGPPVGYEALLLGAMAGDMRLFVRPAIAELSWQIVQPVLDAWAVNSVGLDFYASGSSGPPAADALIARSGDRKWRPIR